MANADQPGNGLVQQGDGIAGVLEPGSDSGEDLALQHVLQSLHQLVQV